LHLKKLSMSKLGSKNKPARIRVKTEERAVELIALCNQKGWEVIVGIEPDKQENIDDIKKLESGIKPVINFQLRPSKNAPCPCGSGKKYKRCCGK
jgi:SWIM/SEC-C metal-binding protein